jgi:hypothetical protein
MSTENMTKLIGKNLHSTISSYQDINTILLKLENQGVMTKVTDVLLNVFQDEHQFTISELAKFGGELDAEDFFDQYSLNSNIFRRNFQVILQSLADEISKQMSKKLQEDQATGKLKLNEILKDAMNSSSEKNKKLPSLEVIQETNSPEVTPSHAVIVQRMAPNMTRNGEDSRSTSATTEQQSATIKVAKVVAAPTGSARVTYTKEEIAAANAKQEQLQYNSKTEYQLFKPEKPAVLKATLNPKEKSSTKAKNIEDPNVRQVTNGNRSASNEKTAKSDYVTSLSATRLSSSNGFAKQQPNNDRQIKSEYNSNSNPVQYNSNTAPAQYNSNPNPAPYTAQTQSSEGTRPNKFGGSRHTPEKLNTTRSSVNNFTKFPSAFSSQVDPSVLDSEFSYGTTGHTFVRSKRELHDRGNGVPGPGYYESDYQNHNPLHFGKGPRKLHDDDNRVPGPGTYETENGEASTRQKSPTQSFCKSPKVTIFSNLQTETPGPLYYPTKHFVSR